MTNNEPQDSTNTSQLPTDRKTSANQDTSQRQVTLADVLDVQQGTAIAVKAENESKEHVVAGRVSSLSGDATVGTKERLEQQLEDCVSAVVLSFAADTWWSIVDGEFTDRSGRVTDRPKVRDSLSAPRKDPPSCSLTYRETGRIGLTIPMPVSNGSRILYYTPDDQGTVVGLRHGAMVQPEHLLPEPVTPP